MRGGARNIAIGVGVLLIAAASALFALNARHVAFDIPEGNAPDAERGRYMFAAAGCGGCHGAPAGEGAADGEASFGGGKAIVSPFGPIYAANISPDPVAGIGAWSDQEFLNAIKRGVSPRGAHYYPAFPYARFAGLTTRDALDIRAYLATTPPVAKRAPATALPAPFNLRIGIGAWKILNAPEPDRADLSAPTDPFGRGRYLVENAAHCGECHTPRTLALGLNRAHAFEGAAGFDGTVAPPLTPEKLKAAGFDAFDQTLRFGLTLDGTGSIEAEPMLDVIANVRMLTETDRKAMFVYLTERGRSDPPPP